MKWILSNMGIVGAAYLGAMLTITDINFLNWEWWVILVPTIIFFTFKKSDMKRKPTIDDIFEDKNGLKWLVVAINPRQYTINCLDSQEFWQIELRIHELVRDYKFIKNAFIVGDGTVIRVGDDGEAIKTNICIDD